MPPTDMDSINDPHVKVERRLSGEFLTEKPQKRQSVRTSITAFAKSMSHTTNANRRSIKLLSSGIIQDLNHSHTPKSTSQVNKNNSLNTSNTTFKRFSRSPGESKTLHKRAKQTLSFIGDDECNIHSYVEKLKSYKYPVYLNFSSSSYNLKSCAFLKEVGNIVKEFVSKDPLHFFYFL